jgi:hypothetical protein
MTHHPEHQDNALSSQQVIANARTMTESTLFMPLVQCIEEGNYELFANLYAPTKDKWWGGMIALHSIKGYDRGLDFQFHEKILKYRDIALLSNKKLDHADTYADGTHFHALLSKTDFNQRCALYFITYGSMTGKKFLQVAILLDNLDMATFLWNHGVTITEKQFLKMSLFGFLKPEHKEFFRLQERYRLQQRLERNIIQKNAKKKKQPDEVINKI